MADVDSVGGGAPVNEDAEIDQLFGGVEEGQEEKGEAAQEGEEDAAAVASERPPAPEEPEVRQFFFVFEVQGSRGSVCSTWSRRA